MTSQIEDEKLDEDQKKEIRKQKDTTNKRKLAKL